MCNLRKGKQQIRDVAWLFLLFHVYFCISAKSADMPSAPTAEERYNFFDIDLLQTANLQVEGNVVISPASAKLALTILAEGSAGHTREELLAALRLSDNVDTIRNAARRTLLSLKVSKNGTEIDVATRLWAKSNLPITKSYSTILKTYYDGDIQVLDFTNTDYSTQIINNWIRSVTHDKIKSLIAPGGLSPDTILMLTSALYFKGKWLRSFDKKATTIRCFHVPKLGCQNTYFMENTAKYRYASVPSLDADVIEIPYTDMKTSMLIVLPNNKQTDQNLQILSKDLSYVSMSTLLSSLEETDVLLKLPKFVIETKLQLRSLLEHIGIQEIFRVTADLSRITSNETIHVGSILQNAKIEVNEEGTIAAAITGVSIIPLMGSTAQQFIANRPFIFIIVDLETNNILFSGRFMQPSAIDTLAKP